MKITEYECATDIIPSDSFYSNESEKIKLNWFCYELSLAIYDRIIIKIGKKLSKQNIFDKAIADFSIYISKELKKEILLKLSRKIEEIRFSYEPIEEYFPDLDDELIDKIQDSMIEAWNSQLDICEVCPNRCISEKDVYCTMFDDESYK